MLYSKANLLWNYFVIKYKFELVNTYNSELLINSRRRVKRVVEKSGRQGQPVRKGLCVQWESFKKKSFKKLNKHLQCFEIELYMKHREIIVFIVLTRN